MRDKLEKWLQAHDHFLKRFEHPVHLEQLSSEIDETSKEIRQFLYDERAQPVYHVWETMFRGKLTRSKPYCLHLYGPDHVCLDWEDSIVGAAEAVFRQRGYDCRREIGSPKHLEQLCDRPSLETLEPGTNLRDLWAMRRNGVDVDLFILEAKGKQAATFDFYNFAYALGQVFPVPLTYLKDLLRTKQQSIKRDLSHGFCWEYANILFSAWKKRGFNPTITVGVLLPEWSPDIIWVGGKTKTLETSYFLPPINVFRVFIEKGDVPPPASNAQRVFGEMLTELESTHEIRAFSRVAKGLRFRLIATQAAPSPIYFQLSGLDD